MCAGIVCSSGLVTGLCSHVTHKTDHNFTVTLFKSAAEVVRLLSLMTLGILVLPGYLVCTEENSLLTNIMPNAC